MAEALADIEDEFENIDESFCVLDDDPGSGIRVSRQGGGADRAERTARLASLGESRGRDSSNGRYGK